MRPQSWRWRLTMGTLLIGGVVGVAIMWWCGR